MPTQLLNKPVSKDSVADQNLQMRVQKAVAAHEKACKALRYHDRLRTDALESLAESHRLLHGSRF